MEYLLLFILLLNVLWFGAGFRFFSMKSWAATKVLLRKEYRTEPYSSIVTQAVKFLGGFNFAFALLSIFSIIYYESILQTQLGIAIMVVFAVAHASQFWFNVPYALEERKGQTPLWSVLTGRMRFIFITDFVLAMGNLLIGISLLFI